MIREKIITISGILLSIILLFFSIRGVKFEEIIVTIERAEGRLIFLPVASILASVLLSAFKWSRITGNNVRVRETFVALIIGLFVNNVLPARIGEVVRAYVLSVKCKLSLTYTFSTVLIDRFFDLTGLLFLTFLFLPKQNLPPQVSRAIYILVCLLIASLLFLLIMSRERFIKVITGKIEKIGWTVLLKISRRLTEVQENLRRVRSPLTSLFFFLIAFLQWLFMSLSLFFVLYILDVKVNPMYVPFVCALLNMGLVVPSSPGYVGIYQFLLVYLLSLFGVPKHEGLTVSILFHASWYIPYNILGFAFTVKEHLNLKDFKNMKKN
ncbi:MAG: flippase-like domain-containing protein [Syntrophorhabdaceae bacterium]|nr:flippase-like domain-containing protein [Syntrophorhabdaceae bacterium]